MNLRLQPTFWPVVQRELRASSRRWQTYWLRVLASGMALVVLRSDCMGNSLSDVGRNLFVGLHRGMLLLLIVCVPLMLADCIASEKREGTLGLLFLTPLTPLGIVIGKGIAYVLNILGVWMAVLPVLSIPLVLGGVTWLDFATAFIFQFIVLVIGVGASLLASALTRHSVAAVILAYLFSGIGIFFVCCVFGALAVKSLCSPDYQIYELDFIPSEKTMSSGHG